MATNSGNRTANRGRGRPATPLSLANAIGMPKANDRAALTEYAHATHCFPVCPNFVSVEARKYWDTICNTLFQNRIVTNNDLMALSEMLDSFGHWLAVKDQLEEDKKDPACLSPKNGYLFMNQQGNRIVNPTMKLYWEAFDRLLRCCSMFGMTPSSRVGLVLTPHGKKKEMKEKARFFAECGEAIDAERSEEAV